MPSKLHLLPQDIREHLLELPARVATCDSLEVLWLFGSFVRGEETPVSDIDLAYLPDAALQGSALEDFERRLYHTIADTLHTDEFTFVNVQRAPAHFVWQVLAGGRVLFCQNPLSVAVLAEAVYCCTPDVRWLRHTGNVDFLERLGMSERSIDKDRVTDSLRLISEALRNLREKARTPKVEYLRTSDIQAIVERRLQVAIESGLNIGNHLIARIGLRAPQDYGDVFRILGEAQILPPELAEQMIDLARFRNLLVHVYWGIDHERLYESLPARLTTLEALVEHIGQWLQQQAREAGIEEQ